MNKTKHVAQGLLAICALLLFIHLGSHPVQASEASVYKETITEILSKSYHEDYPEEATDFHYHVKFNKKTSNLYVSIKSGWRYYYFYWYIAIKAAQKAPLEYTDTFTFKDSTDKYTFNFNDIQALTFKKKFIRQWMQDNQPGEYHEENGDFNYDLYCYNYVEEVLFPKAINHVDYYNKD